MAKCNIKNNVAPILLGSIIIVVIFSIHAALPSVQANEISIEIHGLGEDTIGHMRGGPSLLDLGAYKPAFVCIKPDTTVKWTNVGDIRHTVTSGNEAEGPSGDFDSGIIEPGSDFSNEFKNIGRFEYFDTLHPSIHGTIVVHENCIVLSEEPITFSTYNNSAYDISIEYPSIWDINNKTFRNATGITKVVTFGLPDTSVSVFVEDLDKDQTLEQLLLRNTHLFCDGQYRDAEDDFLRTRIINFSTNVVIAGKPAYTSVCTYGYTNQTFHSGTVFDTKAYYIIYDNSKSDYLSYFPIVQRMINSFQTIK